jgi:hypothetical protein
MAYDDQDILIQPEYSAPLDAYWDNGLSWLLYLATPPAPPTGGAQHLMMLGVG